MSSSTSSWDDDSCSDMEITRIVVSNSGYGRRVFTDTGPTGPSFGPFDGLPTHIEPTILGRDRITNLVISRSYGPPNAPNFSVPTSLVCSRLPTHVKPTILGRDRITRIVVSNSCRRGVPKGPGGGKFDEHVEKTIHGHDSIDDVNVSKSCRGGGRTYLEGLDLTDLHVQSELARRRRKCEESLIAIYAARPHPSFTSNFGSSEDGASQTKASDSENNQ